jgi:hypothetical protein
METLKMTHEDGYVPMDMWAKDHWSTLAYIETVMVDHAGFQVGRDGRMRSNRRNFRVMSEDCPFPKRTDNSAAKLAICMKPEHATILKDASKVPSHDDWRCVQDMAALGFFTCKVVDIEPGVILNLSPLGQEISDELRKHKREGGTFATFAPTVIPAAA